jgi:hypothetical protein
MCALDGGKWAADPARRSAIVQGTSRGAHQGKPWRGTLADVITRSPAALPGRRAAAPGRLCCRYKAFGLGRPQQDRYMQRLRAVKALGNHIDGDHAHASRASGKALEPRGHLRSVRHLA